MQWAVGSPSLFPGPYAGQMMQRPSALWTPETQKYLREALSPGPPRFSIVGSSDAGSPGYLSAQRELRVSACVPPHPQQLPLLSGLTMLHAATQCAPNADTRQNAHPVPTQMFETIMRLHADTALKKRVVGADEAFRLKVNYCYIPLYEMCTYLIG
jgi:hypothetical protein